MAKYTEHSASRSLNLKPVYSLFSLSQVILVCVGCVGWYMQAARGVSASTRSAFEIPIPTKARTGASIAYE